MCQLPQSLNVAPGNSAKELERCVKELGFVGCNLNPDPSGGYFNSPPLTDKWWYPLYEKMVELDVPGMVHVSGCANPAMHTTGSYYLNADTMAFVQLILSDLFKDFPKLRLIIPHGGGAIPFHWGRFRGIALNAGRPELSEIMANNIFFDTCVYHQPGIDLLFKVVPVDNILFASEMVGAVKGNDPKTGFGFDDTKRYVEGDEPVGGRQGEGVRGQRAEGLSAHQQDTVSDRQARTGKADRHGTSRTITPQRSIAGLEQTTRIWRSSAGCAAVARATRGARRGPMVYGRAGAVRTAAPALCARTVRADQKRSPAARHRHRGRCAR